MNHTTPVAIPNLPRVSQSNTRMSSSYPGYLTGAFSPVNENGSFEFDRIVKAGQLLKRGRKTKQYKTVFLVLRPLTISIYLDSEYTKLRHSVNLADITAIARKRDIKKPNAALFTIFTPPRNFHFDAKSEAEADTWIHQIRTIARLDASEHIVLGSSEEDLEVQQTTRTVPLVRNTSGAGNRPSHGRHSISARSFTSISSAGAANFPGSSISLSLPTNDTEEAMNRVIAAAEVEQERVLKSSQLFLLKSKRGVKKWKPIWAVLRPRSLAIYPNDKEYAPILIVPSPTILNAVQIDSPSRNKKRQNCMQIITEEHSWRFCAADENDLHSWIATLKSLNK